MESENTSAAGAGAPPTTPVSPQASAAAAPNGQHDALFLTSQGSLFRFPHEGTSAGFGPPPESVPEGQPGERKVHFIAEGDVEGVMAVGTLPLHHEPGTEFFSCYLTNAAALAPGHRPAAALSLVVDGDSYTFTATAVPKASGDWAYDTAPTPSKVTRSQDRLVTPALRIEDTAYTIDTAQLRYHNPWTAAAWSEGPIAADGMLTARAARPPQPVLDFVLVTAVSKVRTQVLDNDDIAQAVISDELGARVDALLATGAALGTVLWDGGALPVVDLRAFDTPLDPLLVAGQRAAASLLTQGSARARAVDFKANPHIWSLLRNGCIVGRARLTPFTAPGADCTVLNISSLEQPITAASSRPKLVSTLDFKWTPGSKLAIAVKRPRAGNTPLAAISEAVRAWLDGTSLDALVTEWDPKATYDILIDIEPLPRTPDLAVEPEGKVVALAQSALGRYARRRSAGVPTMFLGWVEGLLDDAGRRITEAEYFEHAAFKHIALHELGHAFGLPHLHQRPGLKPEDLLGNDAGAIASGIAEQLGVRVDPTYLEEELLGKWPEDNEELSEWPDPWVDNAARLAALNASVMVGAPVRAALRAQGKQVDTLYPQAPSAGDCAWIMQLYPPTPGVAPVTGSGGGAPS